MKSTLEAKVTVEVDIVVIVVGSLDHEFDILVISIVVVGSITSSLFSLHVFRKLCRLGISTFSEMDFITRL